MLKTQPQMESITPDQNALAISPNIADVDAIRIKNVSVEDIMNCRERRGIAQRRLVSAQRSVLVFAVMGGFTCTFQQTPILTTQASHAIVQLPDRPGYMRF